MLAILIFLILEIIYVENLKKKPFYLKNNDFQYMTKSFNKNGHVKAYLSDLKTNNVKVSNILNDNSYEEAYKIIYDKLELLKKENSDNIDNINTFEGFLEKYKEEIKKYKSCSPQVFLEIFLKYIEVFKKYRYYSFPNVHKYDESLYEWSLKFWSQLIDEKNSKFMGIENIKKIEKWKEEGHNTIIFGNHHIEADANIIKYFFDIHGSQNISRNMIFIGGHKIRVDPLSRPFSVAANLLCIYSKKYIENPPHLKEEKILFNHKSLNALKNLLNEGKQIIWLAPSGGRDRKSSDGNIKISPFDPKIIQTFNIFAKRSKVKTHFVGLALYTYNICPPPNTIDIDEIEKTRSCSYTSVSLNLGEDLFDVYPNMKDEEITTNLYNYVNKLYNQIR
ncbi:glycerol-3-phosphate 1-O-acyltransferase, putative [Plasmodium gallinaceum]|uniref:Glycerol-3-phosphate 1-O-acyltransferase, putative n=1 Tax=Plasmodium gallinaceum TaxID=5849 RepID=A0A1J1GYE0_PLAGA|nr:glycerol-3-phosphate 1-O-acyltransferase, putative [Plasmodium gallinaceum]CRG97572.1 glycerol-3-phosphate 1-O-acyltransferase, putative [Plasmodium gallinaceum]